MKNILLLSIALAGLALGQGGSPNLNGVGVNSGPFRTALGVGTGDSPTFTGINLSGQTASSIVGFDASKNVISLSTATYPSLTELSYVKGGTSSFQTQLNSKLNLSGGTLTGALSIPSHGLTAQTLTAQSGSKSLAWINDTLSYVDLTGNSATISFSGISGIGRSILVPDASGTLALTSDLTPYAPTASPTFTGNATFDTSTLFVDSVNNRVGIGNVSPTLALDITGDFVASGAISGNVYYGIGGTRIYAPNGILTDTAIDFGASNDTSITRSAAGKIAVEGVDVVLAAGNQTIAGDKTFSGQTELTGQAAPNSTSAMTRKLTEDAVTQSPQIQTYLANNAGSSGTSSYAGADATGRGFWMMYAGTATSGYGMVYTATDLSRFSQIDGTGINFTVPFTVSGYFRMAAGSANHEGFHRILIGEGGAAPATADANAFSELGIGIELRITNSPSAHTRQVRMIYYSSGSYKQTSWVTIDALAADDYHKYYSYAIQNDGDGNARLYLTTTAATSGIPRIIGSSAIITVADAPTGLQATRKDYIRIVTVNSSAAYTLGNGYFAGSPITIRLGN